MPMDFEDCDQLNEDEEIELNDENIDYELQNTKCKICWNVVIFVKQSMFGGSKTEI